jgi:regulator of cell morphogenesis and NO signaling
LGIDYCCGGKKTLAQACNQKNLDPQAILFKLQEKAGAGTEPDPAADASSMSLTELVDHIEQAHHAYLHEELPRIAAMTLKVAIVHGEKDPRLKQVQETFRGMALELWNHMYKEEECLFPMIRQLEASEGLASVPGGTVANPIRQMEAEHDDAGLALERLHELTDGYVPPEWACKTYRALLAGLAYLERDMHAHVHKENNVLFPRALEMESQVKRGLPVA